MTIRKFLVLPLIVTAFLLFSSFIFANNTNAQGNCTCVMGGNRLCGIHVNNCDDNYSPQCGPDTQCNMGTNSCSCIANDPGDECGGTSQVCCAGNTCDDSGLTCYLGYCMQPAQLTNAPGNGGGGGGGSIGEVICGTEGINTAIGCIPIGSPQSFTSFLVRWAMGIAGLIAMLFIVYSGFLIMTSSGNPKQVAAGKELLTASVSGLVLLLLSAFILRFIGVEVLSLPGF